MDENNERWRDELSNKKTNPQESQSHVPQTQETYNSVWEIGVESSFD